METLEQRFFKHEFYYNRNLVERFVGIIQNSESKRALAFKNLVFKMMKDIVVKNVNNYLNLLSATNIFQLPERDEIISDCYLIFDKCVEGYKVNCGYNFYFYFNKSLSRNFFRNYTKEQKRGYSHTLIEEEMKFDFNFRTKMDVSISVTIDRLNFTEIEKKLINSKLNKQTMTEFLKDNEDINRTKYFQLLDGIQEKIENLRKQGKL